MKNNDYNEAKELFLEHVGMKYFMALNGTLEKYKEFEKELEITNELELEWLQEGLDEMKITMRDIKNQRLLKSTFLHYQNMVKSQRVRGLINKKELYFMKEFFEKRSPDLDSFTLELMATNLYEIIDIEDDMMKRTEIICDILKILRNALNGEITVSDDYKSVLPSYILSEDEVIDRLRSTIKKYEKEL